MQFTLSHSSEYDGDSMVSDKFMVRSFKQQIWVYDRDIINLMWYLRIAQIMARFFWENVDKSSGPVRVSGIPLSVKVIYNGGWLELLGLLDVLDLFEFVYLFDFVWFIRGV